ncbi:hypothetical protein DMUE_2956 [Dictyocoela muelleri]|nr:hypothetical protein DMUE_2956 [Dictyocoela muelleri]
MESPKRNLIIAICISAAMLLGIIVFIMYGASVVSEINEQQIVMIKESENLQKLKKIIDIGLKTPLYSGGNINCFIFSDNELLFINKNIPNIEYLNNDEMKNNMETKYIIESRKIKEKAIELGIIPYNEIKFDFAPENLVNDDSWSGYIYRTIVAKSIPDKITDIANCLEKLKEEMGEVKIGVCSINGVIYLFIRQEDDGDFEIKKKIYGYGDKITPLELLLFVFRID